MINKILLAIVLLGCPSISLAAQPLENVCEWIMYVGIGPDYMEWKDSVERKAISQKYSFPLYAGYFYTKDSKTIKWHSEVDFVERTMREFAESYTKYPLAMHNVELDGQYSWSLNSPGFFKAAVALMYYDTRLRVLRYERNVPIDKEWKPVFKKQVKFDGSLEEFKKEVSYINGDFTPTNWDPKKNSY